jgi:hypothetical protein
MQTLAQVALHREMIQMALYLLKLCQVALRRESTQVALHLQTLVQVLCNGSRFRRGCICKRCFRWRYIGSPFRWRLYLQTLVQVALHRETNQVALCQESNQVAPRQKVM